MYCIQCGKEIPDDSVFCPNCGVKQETETIRTENRQNNPPPVQDEPKQSACERHTFSINIFSIIAAIAIVLLAGIVILILAQFVLSQMP